MRIIRLLLISLFIVWTNMAYASYECYSGSDCAVKADKEQDLKIQFRYYLKACNIYGVPRACYSASIYLANSAKQPDQAVDYMIKSCKLNYGTACFMIGMLMLDEENGTPNYKDAALLFEKACFLKEKVACNVYGSLLDEGKGLRQDSNKARSYYEKSCNLNYAQGCYSLAISYLELYRIGSDTRNARIAKEYFGKACDLGYQKGCDSYRKLNKQGY